MDWMTYLTQLLGIGNTPTGGFGAFLGSQASNASSPAAPGSSWASWLPTLLNVIGTGYGAYTAQDQMRLMQRMWEQSQQNSGLQRQAALLSMNPTLLAQRAAAASQPLNKQLQYTVTQAEDANLAQQGLAQAPGAMASGVASALAPFEQQNLQTGANLATQFPTAIRLPTAGAPPNYLSLLNQLREMSFNTGAGPYALPQGVNP